MADFSKLNGYYVKDATARTSITSEITRSTEKETELDGKITTERTARGNADANLQSQISALASGSPLVASSVAGMTDTTKVYVNTTDGNWYYYDGDSWEVGGLYQSPVSTSNVDILLKLMGVVNQTLNCTWENKTLYWDSTNRQVVSGPSNARITFTRPITATQDMYFRCNSDYMYSINIFNNAEDEITSSTSFNWSYNILTKVTAGTKFNIVMRRVDNGNISVSEASNLLTLSYMDNIIGNTNTLLCQYGVLFDYKLFNLYNIYANNDQTYHHEYGQSNRATTSDPISFMFNTTLKVKSGYKFSVLILNPSDTTKITQDIGWKTSWTVPANQPVLIKIAKSNDANLTWDDIYGLYIDNEYLKENELGVLIDYDKNVKGIAHRGYSSVAPENTIPSFKLAKQNGFNYVECDVQFTSDNVPVILHDLTINRTARNLDGTSLTETISINDITYLQSQNYDFGIWKGSTYAGIKLPTFEEFLVFCKKAELSPYVELKDDVVYSESQLQSLYNIAKKCGMADKITWISFRGAYLTTMKNIDSKARLGLVMADIVDEYLTLADTFKTGENEVFIDLYTGNVNTTNVNKLIQHDLPLEVWVYDSNSGIANMNSYITGVTSNSLIAGKVLLDSALSD